MDSRTISYTNPSSRSSSRIYQDLEAFRSISHTSAERRTPQITIMGDCFEVNTLNIQGEPRHILFTELIEQHDVLSSPPKPHIGIVGAGVSGLRCADVLLQRGFQVTIIEGRDRVGGRMHQTYLPGTEHLIDVGPNWIHGTDDNPILDIARQTGTITHRWNDRSLIYDEDGNYMSEKEADEFNDIFWKIVVDAFKYSDNMVSIPPTRSLYDYFQMKIETFIPESIRGYERKRRIVMQISERWGAFIGSPITRQSLKFFWLEECIDGENLFCAGTYKQVLEQIAKPVVAVADMKLSTKAVEIATSDEKVGKVIVSTDTGESLIFDEVVVTAPLGWLKKNQNIFKPPLPDRMVQAIDSIGYGCLEKVYITFPDAFWLHKSTSDKRKCLQSCKLPDGHTGFTQWLSPKYLKHNDHHWGQETVDLSTLPDSCAHPTLLFYIFGDQSQAMSHALSTYPTHDSKHSFLSCYFEPYYSLLPHYDASNPSCQSRTSYATNWCSDDLAGNGSYCNFQVGLNEANKDIEIMREGCPERGIWFAGEHTSAFIASGTVTGAYWSGEAVGKRIATSYGIGEEVHVKWKGQEGHVKDEAHKDKEINVRGFADEALEKERLQASATNKIDGLN